MQGVRPVLPFGSTPLGYVPTGPLRPNGLFLPPLWMVRGNGLFDEAGSRTPTVAAGSVPTILSEERGIAASFDGSSVRAYPSASGEFSGSITVVLVWRRNAAGSGWQSVIEKRVNSDATGCEFGLNFNTGSNYQWLYGNGAGYQVQSLGTGAIPAVGTWVTTVLVRSNGAYLAAWQDGVLLGKNTGITATPNSGAIDVTLSGFLVSGVASEAMPLDIACAYILPQAVEDADGAMLSVHPLAPFVPQMLVPFGSVIPDGSTIEATTGAASGTGTALGTSALWSVVGVGSVPTPVASGNYTLTEPTGAAQGDLLVACIASRDSAAFTLPAGWSLVATQQTSGDVDTTDGIASGLMAYIVRGASAPSYTFTRTGGNVAQGCVVAYRGSSATPYDTGSANTLGSVSVTVTTGTITTAESNELIVAMGAGGDNYTWSAFDAATNPTTASGTGVDTTTPPTADTWINRVDSGTNTGADTSITIADAIRASAGATGTIQATSSAAGRSVLIAGAFKVAAAVTTTIGVATGTGTASATSAADAATTGAATSAGTAGATSAALADTTGEASGAGTASGVGAALASTTGEASGAGTATGVGVAAVPSTGAATGAGTASGVGAASAATTGEASGAGTASGVGAALIPTAGTAAGAGTVAGVGAASTATTGDAAGAGTASGTGVALAPTVGSATGTGTALGGGATLAAADMDGAATGTGTASGASAALTSTTGAATGTGTASGAGVALTAIAGAATGTGTASGASAALTSTTGAATGTGTASGAGASLAADSTTGAAVGTGSASGVGAAITSTIGAAVGTGTAAGTGSAAQATIGAATGVGSATAGSAALATTTGFAAGIGSALGVGDQSTIFDVFGVTKILDTDPDVRDLAMFDDRLLAGTYDLRLLAVQAATRVLPARDTG